MTISNIGKFVLYLNKVEGLRLDGYTIHCILLGLENSWMNEILVATPDVSAKEAKPEYEPSENDEEEVGAQIISTHNTSSKPLEESWIGNPPKMEGNYDSESKKRSRTDDVDLNSNVACLVNMKINIVNCHSS